MIACKKPIVFTFFILFFANHAYSQDQDCRNFPRPSRTKVESTPEGPKIVVVVSESVRFDDTDAVDIAREKADMKGAAEISKFLNRDLKEEKRREQAVMDTLSLSGDTSKASMDKADKFMKSISQSSAALLRGVVTLDECYTPGKELRLIVGIKPETIKRAGILASEMSTSLKKNPTPSSKKSPSNGVSDSGQAGSTQDNRQERGLNNKEGYGGGSEAYEKF
jgi:hypothetical protein